MIAPVWIASAVFGLASRTGWAPYFILDQLPLAQFFAFQHAALRADGAWTVPLSPVSGPPSPVSPLDTAQIQAADQAQWELTW